MATTITVSVTIPLFGALAGGLYVVSAIMLVGGACDLCMRLRLGVFGGMCRAGANQHTYTQYTMPTTHTHIAHITHEQWLYLPAANHLKKLRMNTAGECVCYQLCLHASCACPGSSSALRVLALSCFPLCQRHSPAARPPPSPRHSPPPGDLVTLVAESLDGMGVIQAYSRQAYFADVTGKLVNDAHR